ncbi:hypothetical protein [Streptomyces mirabilis]
MDRFVESGQAFTLVTARARRIDERIARLLGEAPKVSTIAIFPRANVT